MISKKYFRVITKPFALTALFLIMVVGLYLAFAPLVIHTLPYFMRTPEVAERELARLSTLGTFLAGVFSGDFGISAHTGRPVSEDLGPSLQVTLLLIGISLALSVIMVMIVVLIGLLWKPAARKPQAFAHSLRGYLFGLIPFLGLILIIVFCYNLSLLPGWGLYPPEWAIYPPQSLGEEIITVLSHLTLPSLSLALIFLARAVMVAWSGVSPIFSENWPKRILFAFATIDFAFIISSVMLVEWGFSLHGIGYLFYNSLRFSDYNGMIGAFIMLLAVTVALGYASSAIDFLLRFSGLQGKLETKTAEPVRSEKQKESLGKKVEGTLLGLLKRKGFVIGSIIIIVFVLLGALAPLITPYDPVKDIGIAEDLAKPYWLPQLLNQNYSTNMNPIEDPGFNQGSASLGNWNITADPQIIYQYDPSVGRSDLDHGSGPGCLSLIFSRTPQGTSYGQAIFRMNHTFDYDQSAPPKRFRGTMAWKVKTIAAGSSYGISVRIKTPIASFDLYESETSSEDTGSSWRTPWPSVIDSYVVDPAREIFKVKGTYTYSIEIAFQNTYSSTDTPSMRMDLDDVNFKTLGDTFGLFGTDNMGRDIWSQLVYGTRTILIIALPLATLAALIGFGFGFIGGYFQGWADNIIMTFVDAIFFIPAFPFLLILMILPILDGLFSPRLMSLLLFSAIAAYGFRNVYLMRPKDHKLKGTMLRDVLSSVAKDLVVGFSLTMMSLVLVLPAIEFFGSRNPAVAGWGHIVSNALDVPRGLDRWWWWFPPVIFTALLALGFFLWGSSLDERFE